MKIESQIKKLISFLSNRLEASKAAYFLKLEAERHFQRAYPPNPYDCSAFDYQWFKYASTTQSTVFYADILPVLADWLFRQPRGSTFRLLDVGGSTGAGAEFLAKIFWNYFTGYKIAVDCIDIEKTYLRLSPLINDHITYKIQDVFQIDEAAYDICICSHTIEHLSKDIAVEFINQVNRISKKLTIFSAPYMEKQLIPGHMYSLDDEFIANLTPAPTFIKKYKSLGWYKDHEPSICLIFTYEK